ncbi:MAG: SDR family NAD(P)-dependent oxidoreductase, partial [Sedimenticolaceae bacterium]
MTRNDSQTASEQRIIAALREARRKLEAAEQLQHQPIAVIGIGCRLPGGIEGPDGFWEILLQGVDTAREVPPERWDIDAYYDPDQDAPGKIYTREASFLDQIDLFDPQFFRISPREAAGLDPQQRLLLEVAWEALENSGTAPDSLRGSDAGCFIGFSWHDYERQVFGLDPLRVDAYGGLGNSQSIAAGRLSFFLGSHGPTSLVDTACSSSLMAVHMACQSLRSGDSSLMLAGGVNLMISPLSTVFCAKIKALSPDGRCKAFDAEADGYGRGEGCGIVVLKRLDDALADGDNVLAVIRGSAINHDGPSSGLTVPSRWAQRSVIESALRNGRVNPLDVTYIEAHGTGTALGDPIEINALGDALGEQRPAEAPLWVGSVKTNIGHLEAAAGVAGLIKSVLAVKHGTIPKSLHFNEPNPLIDWDAYPVVVPQQTTPWPADRPKIIGVSSFGFSGTNCHVVVEEAPVPANANALPGIGGELFCFSARSEQALAALAERHHAHFAAHPDTSLADACYTAAVGRKHFEHRLAICATNIGELRESLAAVVADGHARGAVSAHANGSVGKVAFLFAGQGAQWVGMGRDLYDSHPGFRATLDRCAAILDQTLERSLLDVMFDADSGLLDQTGYTQPALFALEYALAELWQSWGVEPDVLLGHSVGEYVAACLAGVFSLEDGLRLIASRGRLMQALPAGGGMAAVSADEASVDAVLDPWRDCLSIAAVNAPDSVVLSGDQAALDKALAVLAEAGHTAQPLAVSHAFHSPLMEPMLAAFRELASSINFMTPRRPLISNVSGQLADAAVCTADYWVEHVRKAVRFGDGMATLDGLGCGVHVEIGPQATLTALGRRCLPDSTAVWLNSLRRGRPAWRELLGALSGFYTHGGQPDWSRVMAGRNCRRIPLATYPFQRQRYWIDPPAAGAALPGNAESGHPLLGIRVPLPMSPEVRFATRFNVGWPGYIEDHRIFGTLVVAGASHCALFLLGAISASEEESCVLEEIFFLEPFVLDEGQSRAAQLIIQAEEKGRHTLHLVGENGHRDDQWKCHATGKVRYGPLPAPSIGNVDLDALRKRCSDGEMSGEEFYEKVWVQGDDAGISFRWITHLWRGDGEAYCEARAPELLDDPGDYELYPGIIEGCFQLLRFCREFETAELLANGGDLYAPFSIGEFRYYGKPTDPNLHCYAKIQDRPDSRSVIGDLQLFDSDGCLIADIVGFEVRPIPRQALLKQLRRGASDWLYDLEWETQQRAASVNTAGSVCLLVHDDAVFAEAFRLAAAGANMQLVDVALGSGFKAGSATSFTVDPSQPDSFEQLLRTLNDHGTAIDQVVHASSLRPEASTAASMEPMNEQHGRDLAGLLHLIQAVGKARLAKAPRISIVTNNSQHVGPYRLCQPAQAPAWGLGRVIAQEHPEFACRCIDLGDSPQQQVPALLAEIISTSDEDQIALRDNEQRFVARLRQVDDAEQGDSAFPGIRDDVTYWITGGLGGIGRTIAEHLIKSGARHIVLSSRREPDADVITALNLLGESGAQLNMLACDVTLAEQVSGALQHIGENMPPLAGIIHGAGVLDDGIFMQLDWPRFEKVMAPKVMGAWNLHQLTLGTELDFFVCFSSASALFGTMGQANYAAANEYLRALAAYRHGQGLPALSIDWGPWAEVGMAAELDERDQQRARDQGWQSIDPPTGSMLFQTLLKN